jgi:3',5'-cyclic AMP phosphodiesterase CpdA
VRLVWITDPHLNFLPPFGPGRFGESVAREHPDAGAIVITGDIAETESLERCLVDFTRGAARPVYFVLGNHDLYGGSFVDAARAADAVVRATEGQARWLTRAGVVSLSPETVLVGHDGWYDARCGLPEKSRVELADFELIAELHGLSRTELIARVRALGDEAARAAEPDLRAAAARSPRVTFATHVPPFAEACWHMGALSDDDWLPWFTCKAIGDMLLEVADTNPDTSFTVLCGHTHSPGRARMRPNLEVLTGKARYGAPDVHAVLEIP